MKMTKAQRLELENKKLALETKKLALELVGLRLDHLFKLIKILLTVILGLTALIQLVQLSDAFFQALTTGGA